MINVRANEDPLPILTNYHAYVGYEPEIPATSADHSAVNVARGVRMPAASHTTAKGSGPSAVILIP
jgi:hypothetical protein